MKIILNLILLITLSGGYSQSDSTSTNSWCNDTVVSSFKEIICLEDNDTLCNWIVSFDSVSIIVFDRWGKEVRSSTNPYVSASKLFEVNNMGEKLPEVTYYIIYKVYFNNEEKSSCNYIKLSNNCPCG